VNRSNICEEIIPSSEIRLPNKMRPNAPYIMYIPNSVA
jgi:hypothetical protein